MTAATASASPASPVSSGRQAFRLVGLSIVGIVAYGLLLFVVTGNIGTTLQQVANALTIGSIYALIALGYTMVYGIIELINFAHGDVFMVGAFLSVVFVGGILGQVAGQAVTSILPLTLMLLGAFLFVMPLSGLLNLGIERLFYRPLRNAPRLAPLITAIGVSFILQNAAIVAAGSGDRAHPQIFPINDPAWRWDVGGASVPFLSFVIFALAIVLMVGLQQFVGRTRLGRAMRSTAQDPQAAALRGVDLNQTIALTFLLGGAMAGAAGVIWGLQFGFVRFDLGFNAGLRAFTAAVLGGIGNITGAVLGGFIIGFLEVFATTLGQTRWAQFLVFLVLAIVLVFRPAGLLGQQIGERA